MAAGRFATPGDDEVETYEALGITVGRLGEGRDDGGNGDDPGDGLLGDATSKRKRCELVGDVDRPAGREALDDGIEGEAVGDGAGGERDDVGQGFEVRRGDGDVGAVLLAGLEERLGVARRAGGEEHEERLVGAADGRRREIGTQGMSTVAAALLLGGEFGDGDDGAGPAGAGERLGEGRGIADDEPDAGRGDDAYLVVQRPSRVDRRRDGAEAGEPGDDAGGRERRGEAHRGDRDARSLRGRARRVPLSAVEGIDGGGEAAGVGDEPGVAEVGILTDDRGSVGVGPGGLEDRLGDGHQGALAATGSLVSMPERATRTSPSATGMTVPVASGMPASA